MSYLSLLWNAKKKEMCVPLLTAKSNTVRQELSVYQSEKVSMFKGQEFRITVGIVML